MQSHRIKGHDYHSKRHDMTCHTSSPHVTSQPTTLLHLTPQATCNQGVPTPLSRKQVPRLFVMLRNQELQVLPGALIPFKGSTHPKWTWPGGTGLGRLVSISLNPCLLPPWPFRPRLGAVEQCKQPNLLNKTLKGNLWLFKRFTYLALFWSCSCFCSVCI